MRCSQASRSYLLFHAFAHIRTRLRAVLSHSRVVCLREEMGPNWNERDFQLVMLFGPWPSPLFCHVAGSLVCHLQVHSMDCLPLHLLHYCLVFQLACSPVMRCQLVCCTVCLTRSWLAALFCLSPALPGIVGLLVCLLACSPVCLHACPLNALLCSSSSWHVSFFAGLLVTHRPACLICQLACSPVGVFASFASWLVHLFACPPTHLLLCFSCLLAGSFPHLIACQLACCLIVLAGRLVCSRFAYLPTPLLHRLSSVLA
jgi:hypothetical protein